MHSKKGKRKKVGKGAPKKIGLIKGLKDLRLLKERIDLPEKPIKKIEERLIEEIGQPRETIENRLKGLKAEDEFLLLCLVLGNLENIVRLEQRKYVNEEKYAIPDFLASARVPNIMARKEEAVQKLLVEAKKLKVNQDEFIISKRYFDQLELFSQHYSLPLHFALKVDLAKYHFTWWLLVLSTVIRKKSKIEERKIHGGRKESCYVMGILELLKEDYSCLWLSNYFVLIPMGLKIIKEFSSKPCSPIQDVDLGYLVRISCQYRSKRKTAEFKGVTSDNRHLLFSIICKYLAKGRRTEGKSGELKTVTYEADHNYFMPFYHLVLSVYLHLRKEFQRVIGGPYTDDMSYYLDNFSILDQNIVALAKDVLFELSDRKLLLPIKMLPESISR